MVLVLGSGAAEALCFTCGTHLECELFGTMEVDRYASAKRGLHMRAGSVTGSGVQARRNASGFGGLVIDSTSS